MASKAKQISGARATLSEQQRLNSVFQGEIGAQESDFGLPPTLQRLVDFVQDTLPASHAGNSAAKLSKWMPDLARLSAEVAPTAKAKSKLKVAGNEGVSPLTSLEYFAQKAGDAGPALGLALIALAFESKVKLPWDPQKAGAEILRACAARGRMIGPAASWARARALTEPLLSMSSRFYANEHAQMTGLSGEPSPKQVAQCAWVMGSKEVRQALEAQGMGIDDAELRERARCTLKACQSKVGSSWVSARLASKLCLLAAERGLSVETLQPRGVHPLQIIMERSAGGGEELSLCPLIKAFHNAGWLESYESKHPLWVLASGRGRSFKDMDAALGLLLEVGFGVDGSGPGGKVKKPGGSEELIIEWAIRKSFDGNKGYDTQLITLAQAGADLNATSKSGRTLMAYLNTQAKTNRGGMRARAERLFAQFASQGADPTSIVPKKDALALAGSPAIKALVGSHMERLSLLGALDEDILQEALRIAKQMKVDREEAKTPTRIAPRL